MTAVNRDPFHEQILSALERPLDDALFEECVTDLLQAGYPTIASVRGGSDDGFDGSIGTDAGMLPLVATTSNDVIGNFRRNITRYLEERSGPRQAVIATSAQLTPRRKRNLEREADQLGVTLVNIHDRDDLSRRLYHSSRWCRQLLGITGVPSALSAVPPNARLSETAELVGRERDLQWIRETPGDKVIYGQPGSGKTHLLQSVVHEGLCLFAVTSDREQLAQAIRDQRPTTIVVDDALVNRDILSVLQHLRQDLGAQFKLIATCWPNQAQQLQSQLGIRDANVRHLKRLSRDDILTVIKNTGLTGPDEWLNLLLDQAEGKPGLAYALTRAAIYGDGAAVWNGQALVQEAVLRNENLGQTEALPILAVLALAGEEGLTVETLAQLLEISPLLATRHLATLAAGGVIRQERLNQMQVRPPRLRPALIKKYFFETPGALDIDALRRQIPWTSSIVHDVISLKQLEAPVAISEICEIVKAIDDPGCWNHFAYLGVDACDVVYEDPDRIISAAEGLLENDAERAIPALLNVVVTRNWMNTDDHNHPLKRIEQWLVPRNLVIKDFTRNRQILLKAFATWANDNQQSSEIIDVALAVLLHPGFQITRATPGSGRQFAWSNGALPTETLAFIASNWPRIRAIMERGGLQPWRHVRSSIEEWCTPGRFVQSTPMPKKQMKTMRTHGRQMLVELAQIFDESSAWQSWVADTAAYRSFRISTNADPLYESMFSDRKTFKSIRSRELNTKELERVARSVANIGPEPAIRDIKERAQEHEWFDASGGAWGASQLYHVLAENVDEPQEWCRVALNAPAPVEFIMKLLERLRLENIPYLEECLRESFQHNSLAFYAAQLAITTSGVSNETVDQALAFVSEDTVVHDLWLYPQLPSVRTMGLLLGHPSPSIRCAALVGEWLSEPQGEIRPEIANEWERAVVACREYRSHYLGQILAATPALAFQWLLSLIETERLYIWRFNDIIASITDRFAYQQRLDILLLLDGSEADLFGRGIATSLVGNDSDLYRDWFRRSTEKRAPLALLQQEPSEFVRGLARIAAEEGASADEIARHCWPTSWESEGSRAPMFKRWAEEYKAFQTDPNPALHLAGERARRAAMGHYRKAIQEEEYEAVYGI